MFLIEAKTSLILNQSADYMDPREIISSFNDSDLIKNYILASGTNWDNIYMDEYFQDWTEMQTKCLYVNNCIHTQDHTPKYMGKTWTVG